MAPSYTDPDFQIADACAHHVLPAPPAAASSSCSALSSARPAMPRSRAGGGARSGGAPVGGCAGAAAKAASLGVAFVGCASAGTAAGGAATATAAAAEAAAAAAATAAAGGACACVASRMLRPSDRTLRAGGRPRGGVKGRFESTQAERAAARPRERMTRGST